MINLIPEEFHKKISDYAFIKDCTEIIEKFEEECSIKCPESISVPDTRVALNKLILMTYRSELGQLSIGQVLEVVEAIKSAGDYWDCLINEITGTGYEETLPLIKAYSFNHLRERIGGVEWLRV